jgi:hypothetical protein
LKKISTHSNYDLFDNSNARKRFVSVLRQHTSLEELPGHGLDRFPEIKSLLARNVRIRRAKELLALLPRTGLSIGSKSGLWSKAMEKLSSPPDYATTPAGASAIFHIFQARPAILEKQLRRPAAAVVIHHSIAATEAAGGQIRRRL